MKIFAIYANVTLTSKPGWLDEFRRKYDDSWSFHVTLKQPVFVEEKDINKLKEVLAKFFKVGRLGSIKIAFDKVVIDKDENGTTVMVRSHDAGQLTMLQKKLLQLLARHTNYTKMHHQQYEENFDPHITIGRHLSDQQFSEASKYLVVGCSCEGHISDVVLNVVANDTIEEGTDPVNQTTYSL